MESHDPTADSSDKASSQATCSDLKRMDPARLEFLSNISHELRTPLNGVVGMTDLLLQTPLNTEQKEYVESIQNCGAALLAIVNNLLDLASVAGGSLPIETLSFNPRVLAEDVTELLAGPAQEKGLEIVCFVDPKIPEFVRSDPGRIRQALLCLLGNAIKFTESGGVTLDVKCSPGEKALHLEFRVIDTGIGIAPGLHHRILQAFVQADSSTHRRHEGTGIGLTLCNQIVGLLGGRLDFTSEPGRGSCFFFTIPVEESAAPSHADDLFEASLEGVKVLITDDYQTNRRLVKTLLQQWGCRIGEASNGHQALELLGQAAAADDPYRAVILDMHMPGLSGAETGREIKRNPKLASSRLVMLTSQGKRGDAERVRGIGFEGYLAKPVRPQLLKRCLELVLGLRQAADPQESRLVTRHTIAEERKYRLRVLVVEDNSASALVAVRTVEKLGHQARAAYNGAEAIQALASEPFDVVLMDCEMPRMDGYQASRLIRSGKGAVLNSRIPIIALTAGSTPTERAACMEAGMNDCLAKPVHPKDLSNAIKMWTSQSTARKPAPHPVNKSFDRNELLAMTMGDEEAAREIAAVYIEEIPKLVDSLRREIEAGDALAAGKSAHSLKGSSASVGGKELSELARLMQNAGYADDIDTVRALWKKLTEEVDKLLANLRQSFLEV